MTKYKNKFYNDFDTKNLEGRRIVDYRTPFQKDRDRIVHTYSFRRLQAKTQVFFTGEYDFYRTRLTHSIEVAQIGRSISNYLNNSSEVLNPRDFYIDDDLIEAICLAHDIGHPPFGHSGERTLNNLMKTYGGFEGNAQTLREISSIIYHDEKKRMGLNPTRAFLDGVLKYKTLFNQLENPENHFLYNDQKPILDFVCDNINILNNHNPGDSLNSFRSLECEIMDWADDTAFSIHDISDGIRAGFITYENVFKWFSAKPIDYQNNNKEYFENIRRLVLSSSVSKVTSLKIGDFIKACSINVRENELSALTNRYKFTLCIDEKRKTECKFYKTLAYELIFKSPRIQQLEIKGKKILVEMFQFLIDNYLNDKKAKVVPLIYQNLINAAVSDEEKARIICDYLAGMTDGFIIKLYKRMFVPDYGSILDLI